MTPLANHLWQSTIFAALAALLALALKTNQARARHWVWMIASLKFLIPFSILTGLGAQLGPLVRRPIPVPAIPARIEAITQPFAAPAAPPIQQSPIDPF